MHKGRSMYEVYRAKLGDKHKQSHEQQASKKSEKNWN